MSQSENFPETAVPEQEGVTLRQVHVFPEAQALAHVPAAKALEGNSRNTPKSIVTATAAAIKNRIEYLIDFLFFTRDTITRHLQPTAPPSAHQTLHPPHAVARRSESIAVRITTPESATITPMIE